MTSLLFVSYLFLFLLQYIILDSKSNLLPSSTWPLSISFHLLISVIFYVTFQFLIYNYIIFYWYSTSCFQSIFVYLFCLCNKEMFHCGKI